MKHIEITPMTAAIWAMKGIIWHVSTGSENVYFENEFGMTFFYKMVGGYCMI